jgi:hypothetical protein
MQKNLVTIQIISWDFLILSNINDEILAYKNSSEFKKFLINCKWNNNGFQIDLSATVLVENFDSGYEKLRALRDTKIRLYIVIHQKQQKQFTSVLTIVLLLSLLLLTILLVYHLGKEIR